MVEPLIQLPDGTWVVPSDILDISACPEEQRLHAFPFPPRLCVSTRRPARYVAELPTYEDACAARDALALTVNLARAEAADRQGVVGLRRENERLRGALADARAALMNGRTVEERHAAWKVIGQVLTERSGS